MFDIKQTLLIYSCFLFLISYIILVAIKFNSSIERKIKRSVWRILKRNRIPLIKHSLIYRSI